MTFVPLIRDPVPVKARLRNGGTAILDFAPLRRGAESRTVCDPTAPTPLSANSHGTQYSGGCRRAPVDDDELEEALQGAVSSTRSAGRMNVLLA